MLGKTNSFNTIFPSSTDALIRVIAPVGSTVTITKGLVSKMNAGHVNAADSTLSNYYFVIRQSQFDSINAWTVTATLGSDTDFSTVIVDTADEYDVILEYGYYLYRYGNEYISATGGWAVVNGSGTLARNASNMVITSTSTSASTFIGMSSTFNPAVLGTYNALNLLLTTYTGSGRLCVYNQQAGTGTQLAYQEITGGLTEYTADISGVSTGWPKIACFNGQMTIEKIWLS